jgi:hypothetical protein
MTGPAGLLAERYLYAVASQDWETVRACLTPDVVRYGPFGDDFSGRTDYVLYLQRTMPALPGYRMTIDRVSQLSDDRAMVELRETIVLETGPLVTHECLTFEVGSDGLLAKIAVYIRQAPAP